MYRLVIYKLFIPSTIDLWVVFQFEAIRNNAAKSILFVKNLFIVVFGHATWHLGLVARPKLNP